MTTGANDVISGHGRRRTRRASEPAARGFWRAIGTGLSIGIFALVLLLGVAVIVVPKIAGAVPMTILTSSMEPSLPPGTLIVVKPKPIDQIAIGDVMTYQIRSGDPAVISHRVTAITTTSDGERSFITKGDNNSDPDPVVKKAQVRGVLWYSVPWLGYVNSFVNGQQRSWIIPALAAALLAYAAFMIISGLVGTMRRRRRSEASSSKRVDRARKAATHQ